jgi:hypothetical protein
LSGEPEDLHEIASGWLGNPKPQPIHGFQIPKAHQTGPVPWLPRESDA